MKRLGKKIIVGIILNSSAVLLSELVMNYLGKGFYFKGSWGQLIFFALILTLTYIILEPILHLVLLPFIWITLGVFNLVVSLTILKIATMIFPVLVINSFLAWIVSSFIVGLFNTPIRYIK